MDDFERELKNDFLNEATDLLGTAEISFMRLETEADNITLVDEIFRFAHNLKGTSRAVGFGQIAELTHVAESVLLKIKQKEIVASAAVIDALLRFNDMVATMVGGLKENLEASFEISELVSELDRFLNQTPDASPVVSESQVSEEDRMIPSSDAFPEDEPQPSSEEEALLAQAMAELFPQESSVAVKKEEVPAAKVEIPKPAPAAVKPPAVSKTETRKDDETIRVSLSRLETLGDLVGELVILQTVVERALIHSSNDNKTRRSLSKLCKDIQDMSLSLRMIPIVGAFQKLQRIVRDTSKTLDKKVELRLVGEDTEIDRTVVERLGDPLVHLVRNSVDHGVEMPAARLAAGKEETGVIEVMASHEGNNLIIQITDDGAGMDPQKLMAKARQKGILREGEVLSENDALNLIFHPGFSTKDAVSEVSGRGVGMDVVKTNIEALGGEIKLRSKIGVGSCVRLVLPLTLAIIDGMLVQTQGQQIVVPRNQIHEINRLDPKLVHKTGGAVAMYRLRDEILPLYTLAEEWGKDGSKDSIVLIVRGNSGTYAVGVEDVIRQQQVVVKPPTAETMGRGGVMGTTILGDGMPALIVDLLELYNKRNKRNARSA